LRPVFDELAAYTRVSTAQQGKSGLGILSRKEGHVGAVAFSRTGDPATGDFSDAKVIKKFGEVPGDLSSL
jgi:hypothetical protein